MKKVFMAIIIVMSVASIVYSYSKGTGKKTTSAVISATPCTISAIEIHTDGTNDSQVVLYDNSTGASGTIISDLIVLSSARFGGRYFDPPRKLENGLYALASGATTTYIIDYY